jgi:hypothetical protein
MCRYIFVVYTFVAQFNSTNSVLPFVASCHVLNDRCWLQGFSARPGSSLNWPILAPSTLISGSAERASRSLQGFLETPLRDGPGQLMRRKTGIPDKFGL